MKVVKNWRQYVKRIATRKAFVLAPAIAVVVFIAGFVVLNNKAAAPQPEKAETIQTGPQVEAAHILNPSPNPLQGAELYVSPDSNAATQAAAWRETQPERAKLMDVLAAVPQARWVNTQDEAAQLGEYVAAAAQDDKTVVLVSYYFPHRDCGGYSAGGAKDEADYRSYIDTFAAAIGDAKAIIILEPDALSYVQFAENGGQPCLSTAEQDAYMRLMQYAIEKLKAQPNTTVYVDAGNSDWIKNQSGVADTLKKAGVAKADGFSLNVSNFQTTVDTIRFGEVIAGLLDGKHFVIDTSRNGLGPYDNQAYPSHDWCNPPGRALGRHPTTKTGHPLVDAFLYIKRPGESDGSDPNPNKCFNGPKAGNWWPEYAIGLIERWPPELQSR